MPPTAPDTAGTVGTVGVAATLLLELFELTVVQFGSLFGSHVTVPSGFDWQFGSLFGSHVTVAVGVAWQFGSLFGSQVDVGFAWQFGSLFGSQVDVGFAPLLPLQVQLPFWSNPQLCVGVGFGFGQPLPAMATLWPWTFLEQTGFAFGTLPSMSQAVPMPEGFVGNVCGAEEKSASAKVFQIFAGQ